jgi:hypothetical protein
VVHLLKHVDLTTPDRFPYNLIEFHANYSAMLRKKHGDKPFPKAAYPPMNGTPSGYGYELFRDLRPDHKSPVVVRVMGDVMELGRLSDEGEFQPEPDMPIFPRVNLPDPSPHWLSTSDTIYYNIPNKGAEKEDVYEYRSGRLLKGTLNKSGNFAPEVGSKVLDFKEYGQDRVSRRIYNLPGRLLLH